MKTRIDQNNTPTVFTMQHAEKLADHLNHDIDDPWLYEVISIGHGKAQIKAYDENRNFVACF